jgi:hypothetical protein
MDGAARQHGATSIAYSHSSILYRREYARFAFIGGQVGGLPPSERVYSSGAPIESTGSLEMRLAVAIAAKLSPDGR